MRFSFLLSWTSGFHKTHVACVVNKVPQRKNSCGGQARAGIRHEYRGAREDGGVSG